MQDVYSYTPMLRDLRYRGLVIKSLKIITFSIRQYILMQSLLIYVIVDPIFY